MIPCGEWWEADLCLDVQQLEPAIPDLQEQVLAPHLALSIHFLQLLQGILGLLDSLRPQLTCQQVLRGEEEMQDSEKVWRRGITGGNEQGWGLEERQQRGKTCPWPPCWEVPGNPYKANFKGQCEGQRQSG